MYSGSARLQRARAASPAAAHPPAGHHVRHQPPVARRRPRAPPPPPRARPACSRSAASISPSSMRKPRIFTWWSTRPRNSSCPSAQPPRPVARAVQPRAGSPNGSGDEALRRQLRPAQVAARHPRAADVQLARHAHRHRLATPRPARRSARCRAPARCVRLRRPPMERRGHRAFGRAVLVDHLHLRAECFMHRLHHAWREHLARHQHQP